MKVLSTYRYERRQWSYSRWTAAKITWSKTFIEPVLFKIALCLDENPAYCWAELVMWSLRYRPIWEIVTKNEDYKSKSCTVKEGAYCGKCIGTGRLPNYLTSTNRGVMGE